MVNDTIGPVRETTLRDFFAVVFRRSAIILIVMLVAVVTVLLMNARIRPIYLSDARILVSRGEPESAYNSRMTILPWDEELASEIEVIKSTTLGEKAQKVLTDAHAVDSEGQEMRFKSENVKATTSGRASVILMQYTSADPIVARECLRALVRVYGEYRTQEKAVPSVDGFFQEELESLRDQLSQWEQRRADFMSDEGIVDLPSEQQSLLRQRESAEIAETTLKTKLADYAARLEAIRGLQDERKIDQNVEVFGLGDPDYNDDDILSTYRRELISSQSDYLQKKAKLTDDHPAVKAAKQLVDQLQGEVDRMTENYVRFLEARVAVCRARISSLETSIRGIDDELNGMPDKAARMTQYDRILDALRTDYSNMVEHQISAKVETSGRPEWRVVVLQAASVAERQRTRDVVRMALVPFFALLIGLALAFVIDGLDHSLKDPSEVETHLKLPVLGSLSKIR